MTADGEKKDILEINRKQAKQLAIDFLLACVSADEADGHQLHEKASWFNLNPECEAADGSSFIVTIGDHRVRFRATIDKFQPPGARDFDYR